MHQVTVTIVDIERATYDVFKFKHQRYLQLTFRSEDGSRQWWEVPGWPEVRPGMTVTALLLRPIAPNRSNRVLGWKCHETGQLVVGQSPIRSAVGSIVFAIMGALALRQKGLQTTFGRHESASKRVVEYQIPTRIAGIPTTPVSAGGISAAC